MSKEEAPRQSADRESQRATLLAEALRRPGVRDLMVVYHNWEQTDRQLDSYRMATAKSSLINTTDHANTR